MFLGGGGGGGGEGESAYRSTMSPFSFSMIEVGWGGGLRGGCVLVCLLVLCGW